MNGKYARTSSPAIHVVSDRAEFQCGGRCERLSAPGWRRCPREATLSLYLHVPVLPRALSLLRLPHQGDAARRTDRSLCAAAGRGDRARRRAHAGKRKVTHIHWGGGTPSILDAELLKFVTDELDHRFDLSALREHAIELDPRYVTQRADRGAARHRRQPRQPRRAGLQPACASRPPAASSRSRRSRPRSTCSTTSASTASTSI